MIRAVKGGYSVFSEDGSKHLGGPYATEAEAKKRLAEVEYFKKKGAQPMNGGGRT